MAISDDSEKPVKINKWDNSALKNTLDDAVTSVVKDKLHFDVKYKLYDIRLAISAIAVGFAGFALLWDWLHPFPKSRSVLIICVLAYFALMGLLQTYMWIVEGKIFLVAVDRDPTGSRPERVWNFSSFMKKYDHVYQLDVSVSSKSFNGSTNLEQSVAIWFDEEGNFLAEAFHSRVQALVDSLADQKKRH